MKYGLLISLILLIAFDPTPYIKFKEVTKYDSIFSKYTKRYFGPAFDWRYFKAQAVAESQLDETAKSRVGALGIMQIMPGTIEDLQKHDPVFKGAKHDPRWNIAAGISYNRQIWKKWGPKRTFQDKINFMFGSYNAGRGNIIKAQSRAKRSGLDPHEWQSIKKALPDVTGRHSKETILYVEKINKIKEVLY